MRRRIKAGRSRTSLYRDELPTIKVAVFVVHYIKSQVKFNLDFKRFVINNFEIISEF